MRTKTAYRDKPESPAPPEIKIDGIKAEPIATHATDDIPAEPSAALAAEAEALKADEASAALRRQIEALTQSEAIQRQRHAAASQQRPPMREQLLHKWRQEGMGPSEEQFFRDNPAMIDNPQATVAAANEAAQHHARGTDAHKHATKQIFEAHMSGQPRHVPAAAQDTPAFFQPPPPPAPASASSIYSAPVSRTVPTGGHREPSPSQVRLSLDEQETARMSGISDIEYAKHKLRLEREKANGERQQ